MSATTSPMDYDSLKILLQYLDFNARFQISRRCPSIRRIEKLIPQKLDHLRLANCTNQVNSTTYRLEIRRHVAPGDEHILNGYAFIGKKPVQKDIDQFGFDDPSSINIMTPGDINFRHKDERLLPERDTYYQRREQLCESRLADDLKCLNDLGRPTFAELDASLKRVQKSRAALDPFRRKRENDPPPCTYYLQLSIVSANRKYVEILEYNKKIHEASKYLNELLFGNRQLPFIVNDLILEDRDYIFRLPTDFKVKVKNLEAFAIDFSRLKETIQFFESYNMTVEIEDEKELLGQMEYKTAKQLAIVAEHSEFGPEELLGLENPKIRLKDHFDVFPYTDLIENWIQSRKAVGFCCSFGVGLEESAKKRCDKLKSEFSLSLIANQERFFTLPMPGATSQLRVSYEHENGEDERLFESNWCLVFKVEQNS